MVTKSVNLLIYLEERADDGWLVGYNLREFNCLTQKLFKQLIGSKKSGTPPKILLSEPDPFRFLASFLAAVAANCPIFLCNHNWGQQEWQQVFNLVQPNLIWGQFHLPVPPRCICVLRSRSVSERDGNLEGGRTAPRPSVVTSKFNPQNSTLIMLPTGGSSGKIRFAMHTWETLTASVTGFHRYFGNEPINSFCILPLYHVSGLMQFMRSFLTGGNLLIYSYKALKAGARPEITPADFISLVPTQLQTLLQSDPQWLSCFQTVLLGGAPAWQTLLDTARNFQIPLAPTYGMTETASQIVTLKPEAFLSGNNSSGQVLSHAQVGVCSDTGELLNNQVGHITIKANSLCLGYYPDANPTDTFSTDDLGYFDAQGYLHIVGRSSQKIITGGENVFPAEVEAAILATQLVKDVCVIGLSDRIWGQAVTAVYIPKIDVTPEIIQKAIADKLSKFKQPKHWIPVEVLPRNAQGKVTYQQLNQLATARVFKVEG